MTDETITPVQDAPAAAAPKASAKRPTKPAAAAKPAARAKTTHRADAAQTFMAGWLPQHAVSATAFTADDAQALLAAIDGH